MTDEEVDEVFYGAHGHQMILKRKVDVLQRAWEFTRATIGRYGWSIDDAPSEEARWENMPHPWDRCWDVDPQQFCVLFDELLPPTTAEARLVA